MSTPVMDTREIPGGLFTLDHWWKLCVDLLSVVDGSLSRRPVEGKVKPQTKSGPKSTWITSKKQKRLAKERALAKLTYDDKIALGYRYSPIIGMRRG